MDCAINSDEFAKQLFVGVLVVSILSSLGGLGVIIKSLACKIGKKTRSIADDEGKCSQLSNPGAHLLIYISLADIIVAISHIWGVYNYYYELEPDARRTNTPAPSSSASAWLTECGAQATLAIFGTISSFLWTLTLAFMALVEINREGTFKDIARSNLCFAFYHILLWGIPIFFALGLGASGNLGLDLIGTHY